MEEAVLEEVCLDLVNKARKATKQEKLYDLPKGLRTDRASCPLALALNKSALVSGASIKFPNTEIAKKVADTLGLKQQFESVLIPTNHPFQLFIEAFDSRHHHRKYSL